MVATHRLSSLALAVCLAAPGCNEQAPAPGDQPAAGEAAAGQAAAGAPAKVEEAAFVLSTTGLRRSPTLDKKVQEPGGDKLVANWITNLYRGEQVQILGTDGDWSKVRTSSDQEGYLQTKSAVRGTDASLTTALEQAKSFRRPDLTTVEANAVLEPGVLLFALQEKDQFTKVDYPRSEFASSETWILSERLSRDEREVAASKLVTKLRYLKAKNDPTAAAIEDLARSQFGGTKVVELLDAAKPADAAPGEGGGGAAPAGAAPGGEGKPAEQG